MSNHNDKPYVLEHQVGFLLRRAHQLATAHFNRLMPTENLTPPQFSVLLKMHELGQVSQNQLGRLVDIDQSTVQGIVSRLCQRGLVDRLEDPHHKSRLLLNVTNSGLAELDKCLPAATEVSQETLAHLAADEQQELLRLLQKLIEPSTTATHTANRKYD